MSCRCLPSRIAALDLSDLDLPVPGGRRRGEGEGQVHAVGGLVAHVDVNYEKFRLICD